MATARTPDIDGCPPDDPRRDDHCWHMAGGVVPAIQNPPQLQRCCHCGWYRKMAWDRAAGGHGGFAENPGAYVAIGLVVEQP